MKMTIRIIIKNGKKMRKIVSLILPVLLAVLLTVPAFADSPAPAVEDGSFWGGIGTFFVNLFVPADDYFVRKSAQLSAHANEKLGGVADLYHMINDFFDAFDQARTSSFYFQHPSGFFTPGSPGFNINLFNGVEPVIRVIKAILTAAVCLITAIACYHKLRKFFKE